MQDQSINKSEFQVLDSKVNGMISATIKRPLDQNLVVVDHQQGSIKEGFVPDLRVEIRYQIPDHPREWNPTVGIELEWNSENPDYDSWIEIRFYDSFNRFPLVTMKAKGILLKESWQSQTNPVRFIKMVSLIKEDHSNAIGHRVFFRISIVHNRSQKEEDDLIVSVDKGYPLQTEWNKSESQQYAATVVCLHASNAKYLVSRLIRGWGNTVLGVVPVSRAEIPCGSWDSFEIEGKIKKETMSNPC